MLERSQIRRIIDALPRAPRQSSNKLIGEVYTDLRRLAARQLDRLPPGQTLGPTALVHEAYLRLADDQPADHSAWDNPGHFYAAAAEAMRRVLIDRARAKGRIKRGGARRRTDLDLDRLTGDLVEPADLLDLDAALDRLEALNPQAAALVKLRLFAGLNHGEAAEVLGIARRTADRDWAFARSWLHDALSDKPTPSPPE